jgi:carboxyl-terminal processing protease
MRRVCLLLAAAALISATPDRDLTLGRSIETLADFMRDVSVYYVEPTDPAELLKDATAGLTAGLDPYTELIPADEMDDFEVVTTGKYGGIGAVVRKKGDYVAVAQPYEGSPADLAGLVAGDRFVMIDTVNVVGADTERVSNLLRGKPGSKFTVRVLRLMSGQEEDIAITRERISIPAVPYYTMLDGGVGYIHHSDFSDGAAKEMRRALDDLRGRGTMKGLILDYRGNGGGILQEAVEILSMFVPRGTEVVSTRGRRAEMTESYRTSQGPVDVQTPIVVLTDNHTASASEIVAGALKDLDRAVLMGQRTFGKGRVQITRPVGYGSYLKVTAARYYLPKGQFIDSVGVAPDVALEPEYMSHFAALVYARGYISDFADDFIRTHPDARTVPYSDFVAWMEDKELDYESPTRRALAELTERARRDMLTDALAGPIASLEASLKDDRASSLELYRKQLQELLDEELATRHGYTRGAAAYRLEHDPEAAAAAELLRDGKRYDKIIAER